MTFALSLEESITVTMKHVHREMCTCNECELPERQRRQVVVALSIIQSSNKQNEMQSSRIVLRFLKMVRASLDRQIDTTVIVASCFPLFEQVANFDA